MQSHSRRAQLGVAPRLSFPQIQNAIPIRTYVPKTSAILYPTLTCTQHYAGCTIESPFPFEVVADQSPGGINYYAPVSGQYYSGSGWYSAYSGLRWTLREFDVSEGQGYGIIETGQRYTGVLKYAPIDIYFAFRCFVWAGDDRLFLRVLGETTYSLKVLILLALKLV